MADALADADDYAARYGETEDPRLDGALADASAKVRAYCDGLQFTAGETTQILRAVDGKVRLPQRPVVSIDSMALVQFDGATTVPIVGWFFDGIDQVVIPAQSYVLNLPEAIYDSGNPFVNVQVSWTYGYDTIPDEIIAVVCASVNRALNGSATIISESIGSYHYRTAPALAVAELGFTDGERDILNNWKRRAGTLAT